MKFKEFLNEKKYFFTDKKEKEWYDEVMKHALSYAGGNQTFKKIMTKTHKWPEDKDSYRFDMGLKLLYKEFKNDPKKAGMKMWRMYSGGYTEDEGILMIP